MRLIPNNTPVSIHIVSYTFQDDTDTNDTVPTIPSSLFPVSHVSQLRLPPTTFSYLLPVLTPLALRVCFLFHIHIHVSVFQYNWLPSPTSSLVSISLQYVYGSNYSSREAHPVTNDSVPERAPFPLLDASDGMRWVVSVV
jgi:hypothetical protein